MFRHCALRFDARETYKVFKISSSLVHLGKGRCGSEKTAEKNVAGYIGTLWL